MRILASRHSWYPRTKIAGLKRYAFIGDSNVFGQGVNAGEAFPARAGVLMNEATCVAVEAVNLGINGYNIWNSWLSFRQMPQVYEGVVFTLCNNDAQLFGRSFAVDYKNADPVLWEKSHAYRGLIVDAFDDVARFARNVPVLIGYCNLWAGKPFEEIADTMRSLCEERGLPFVNFYAHFVERRMPRPELIVSDADHHPSPLAHDAMARHLVQVLRRQGWIGPPSAEALATAPATIAEAADAMIAEDDYPRDAALEWARAALEAKKRLASRLEDHATRETDSSGATADRIETARRHWQREARTAAIVDQLMTSERGLSGALNHVEEEILRLEELDAAIDKGGWAHIAAELLRLLPEPMPPDDAKARRMRIAGLNAGLNQVVSLKGDDGDTHMAKRLAALTRDVLVRFERAVDRVQARLDARRDGDSEIVLATLANRSIAMAMERFERVGTALAQLLQTQQTDPHETTLEVSVRTNRIEGRHPCLLEVIASYTAPRRLAMRESRYFLPDGELKRLAMRLPLLYAGRIVVSLRLPPAVAASIDADVAEMRLSNASVSRTIARADFITDSLGRLISPQVWLV